MLGTARPAWADHFLGGELTNRYLDAAGPSSAPLRYEITLRIYNNGNPGVAAPTSSILLGIYQLTGAQLFLTSTNYAGTLNRGFMGVTTYTSSTYNGVPVPPGCPIGGATQQPYVLRTFQVIVNLPRSSTGFYVYWTAYARNLAIANLVNPSGTGLSLYSSLAPSSYANHSPVFATPALALVCVNDTTTLLNNAVDADGDRLVYSFGTLATGTTGFPSSITIPPAPVTYASGYSGQFPLGNPPNYARIDPATGITKIYATTVGAQYAIAIDVQEYRQVNGQPVLIGITRRDIQLVVGTCPNTPAPVLPTALGTAHNYSVEAGSTLSIPLTTTQASGHPLDLTASSVLLDGPGGYQAALGGNAGTVPTGSPVGSATVSGTGGLASSTLVYTPSCADARPAPYDVTLLVQDQGCGGKLVVDILHITVTKPAGPTALTGNLAVCGLNSTQSYAASGGTAPGVSWRLSGGGSLVSGSTTNPVSVLWTTAGTYTLTARGLTQYGCLTDSVTQTVVISPLPVLSVTGPQTICQGSSSTLAVAGAPPYTLTGGPVLLTGPGPFVLSPTQTTTYIITGAPSGVGCVPTTTVTLTVNAAPAAATGPPVRTCPGVSVSIGAAPVAGSTYSWSPATGLSSTTAANPTVTLPNTSGAPLSQVYTLTETTAAGCATTSSVMVTVNADVVAQPGPALALCSNNPGQLGTAPVAGLSYSWSPATGLSSATIANPTVTLTNTGSAVTTQAYLLTVIDPATGCTSTGSVAVTVAPVPLAVPGVALVLCSGGTGRLGAAPAAGLAYSWSPATGLSSPTVANPLLTLTNPGAAPLSLTYTLTVTDPATGCASTGTVGVTVSAPLLPGIIGSDQLVCALVAPSPLVELTPASGGTGAYTYQWESSPDNIIWTALPGINSATYAPGMLTASTYFRRRVSSGACGSALSAVVYLQRQPALVASVTLPAPATQCAGSSVTLTPVPANVGPAPTYLWLVNGVLAATTPVFTSSTLTDGDQVTVELAPTAGFCATGRPTATVTAHFAPVLHPTVTVSVKSPVPSCGAESVSFALNQATDAGAAPTYQWQVDGQPVAGATATTFASNSLLDGQAVTLVLTARNACGTFTATSARELVRVEPVVAVSAGPDFTIMEGDEVQLQGTASGPYPVSWFPAVSLSSPSLLQPTASPMRTTTYTLSAGTGRCTAKSAMTLTVTPRLRIPSAFTPNGDGTDDTWQLGGISAYPGSRVLIFNRWGSKLFEATDYGRGPEWAGTVGGQPVPVGTYYYIITLPSGKRYTGPLTIIY